MESHHNDRVRIGIVVVDIRHKGNFLKEAIERRIVALLLISHKVGFKLVQVLFPVLSGVLIEVKELIVACHIERFFKKLMRLQLLCRLLKLIYH